MAVSLATFCTVCATANPGLDEACAVCGAPIRHAVTGRTTSRRTVRVARRRTVALLPVVVVAAIALAGLGWYRVEQRRLADWYAQAEAAEAAGYYSAAADLFAQAEGYRDAEERRAAALNSYRAVYREAAAALDAGRYDEAIALLVPLARRFPGESDATLLLAQARDAREADLRTQADLATRRGDWLAAEQALTQLEAATGEPAVAAELAAVQREHAPLVVGRADGLYLIGPHGDDVRLVTDVGPATQPAWSPDRTRIAFASPDADEQQVGALYVINADGTGLRRLAEQVAAHRWPVWSPDGTKLAYTSYADFDFVTLEGRIGMRVVDVATGVETDLSEDRWDYAASPSWSPDGTRLAFVTQKRIIGSDARLQFGAGQVQVLDLESGAIRSLTGDRLPGAWRVAWNPVNDWLIVLTRIWREGYGSNPTDLYLVDAATGTIETIDAGRSIVSIAYWSPDGRRFAYVEEGSPTLRIGAPGESVGWVRLLHPVSEYLSWSPDSSAILAAAPDAYSPSILVRLDGPVTTQEPVRIEFVIDWYATAPPQWSARNPSSPTGPPSTGGTAHDRAGPTTAEPQDAPVPVAWPRRPTPATAADEDADAPFVPGEAA
jgi:Tol biopolymer transport system component